MKNIGRATLLTILPWLALATRAHAEDCSARWEEFSSRPYEQIALPDTYVTYWRLRYEVPAGGVTLRITGDFPHARYVNFNAYDQKTLDSSGSLPDVSIAPDPGSVNPFLPGADRDATRRAYTVWVVPRPEARHDGRNEVTLPTTGRLVELWYRVYMPDAGVDANGGVPLPRVEAFRDAAGSEPAPCPAAAATEPNPVNAIANLPPANPRGTLHFFHSAATSLYANLDNEYLATRFRLLGRDTAVVRFKAPRHAATRDGRATFPAEADVRYWSLCLGGLDQRVSACVADADAPVDANGYVTLVIGPESLREVAKQRGQAFLPWGRQRFQVLIYRNLLASPTFAGDLHKVPKIPLVRDDGDSVENYAAHRHIGDYAPTGAECTAVRYRVDGCGVGR